MTLLEAIARVTGLTRIQIGEITAWLVAVGICLRPIVPWLGLRLPDWRASARATRTLADDRAVRFIGWVHSAFVAFIGAVGWIARQIVMGVVEGQKSTASPGGGGGGRPLYSPEGPDTRNIRTGRPNYGPAVPTDERVRRVGIRPVLRRLVGLLAANVLILGACALPGCARGQSDTTPLHRAAASSSAFSDAGVFAHDELRPRVEATTEAAYRSCRENAETGVDCREEARNAATVEWGIFVAAHNLYAEAANNYRDGVRRAAELERSGQDPGLADVARLAARVLTTYEAMAALFREAGINLPPLPAAALSTAEALR